MARLQRLRSPLAASAAIVAASVALVFITTATEAIAGSTPLPRAFPGFAAGSLYHGVHPSGLDGDETFRQTTQLTDYERLAGRRAAWVYFSQEWSGQRAFPAAKARGIRDRGSLPVVRLMLRSSAALNGREGRDPAFGLARILDGSYDVDVRSWARGARAFGAPVLVELGTEVNGDWFGWNGRWNGGSAKTGYGSPIEFDGPERFRDAFRRIVTLMRAEGARNVGFVFHADAEDSPTAAWNRMEAYYPGNAYVDLIGISAYGSQTPLDDYTPTGFRLLVDRAYARLHKVAPAKPVAVLEFGTTKNGRVNPTAYAAGALADLLGRRWPQVVGFASWNEGWPNDENPRHNTTMRLQEQPSVAAVFRSWLAPVPRLKTAYP